MFVLITNIQDAVNLLRTTISKLSKLHKPEKPKHKEKGKDIRVDDFMPNLDYENIAKSLKEVIKLVIELLTRAFDPQDESNEDLKNIKETLCKAVSGNLAVNLTSESFKTNLTDCLKELLGFCKRKKKEGVVKELTYLALKDLQRIGGRSGGRVNPIQNKISSDSPLFRTLAVA